MLVFRGWHYIDKGHDMEQSEIHITSVRCPWCGTDPLYVRYHDEEWGYYNPDRCHLFEFIVLESAQAGLSWLTILRKRRDYSHAFFDFRPELVASMTWMDVNRLMTDTKIVRHRGKITAAIVNARVYLCIENEFGSFDTYLRRFLPGGQPVDNRPRTISDVPRRTPYSVAISHDLHRRGFRFFGPTICYAFLEATGYVNDHIVSCHCRDVHC